MPLPFYFTLEFRVGERQIFTVFITFLVLY